MSIKTFKRVEKKFMVDRTKLADLLEVIEAFMTPDEYSKNGKVYSIYNIYYDTDDNEIIRRSISKPYYKEKLRLRSYKLLENGEGKVFLELKKKIGGVVSKRRAKMTFNQAEDFVEKGIIPTVKGYVNSQVVNEIAEFISKNEVHPRVYIAYDRLAFFGQTDESFRVTFDSNIRTRRSDLTFQEGKGGSPLLPQDKVLMEIKINGAIPLWLSHTLSSLEIYPTSFSKYGTEYKQYCNSKADKTNSHIDPIQTIYISTRKEKHYA